MAIVLIIGGYQFYFFSQRHGIKSPVEFYLKIDNQIPFRPSWVWIYSGLYYPVILILVLAAKSFEQFNQIAFSFLFLLFVHLVIFYLFPVKTPKSWRDFGQEQSISTKFLSLVHNYDDRGNCFPSAHVSIATLTSLHLFQIYVPQVDAWAGLAFLFPLLNSLSTLYTKQHYIIDEPTGVLLGDLTFNFYIEIAI